MGAKTAARKKGRRMLARHHRRVETKIAMSSKQDEERTSSPGETSGVADEQGENQFKLSSTQRWISYGFQLFQLLITTAVVYVFINMQQQENQRTRMVENEDAVTNNPSDDEF